MEKLQIRVARTFGIVLHVRTLFDFPSDSGNQVTLCLPCLFGLGRITN